MKFDGSPVKITPAAAIIAMERSVLTREQKQHYRRQNHATKARLFCRGNHYTALQTNASPSEALACRVVARYGSVARLNKSAFAEATARQSLFCATLRAKTGA